MIKKKDLIRFALVSVVTSLMVTASSYMGYFEPVQRKALDFMVWWKEKERPSQIVIVAIDDEAFQYLGDRQPLPRKQLASLIALMKQSGAKVIGLDVELKARTDRLSDELIEKAIQERTVITYDLSPTESEGQFRPQELFVSGQGIRKGFANTYIDSDGLIRKAPLMVRDDKGDAIPSFALAVAGLFR
ncbi:MAG: CHASE2 domain-containing protein, partial [Nitrospirota bacterium]|nr:CHASE2 domain-containing protein [Nitrospirota bacterium]